MFRRKEEMSDAKPASSSAEPVVSTFSRAIPNEQAADVSPSPVGIPVASTNSFVTPATESMSPIMQAPVSLTSETPAEPVVRAVKSPFEAIRQFPERVYKVGEPIKKADEMIKQPNLNPNRVPNQASNAYQTNDKPAAKRVLTVGQDTLLKGEISTCDRVIVEGAVEAKMADVQLLEIAETGTFRGSANVDEAEISGVFDGDLIVKNRLMIYSTGVITGKIMYGEIEIQRGGTLTGEMKLYANIESDHEEKPVAARPGSRNRRSNNDENAQGEDNFSGSISELFAS